MDIDQQEVSNSNDEEKASSSTENPGRGSDTNPEHNSNGDNPKAEELVSSAILTEDVESNENTRTNDQITEKNNPEIEQITEKNNSEIDQITEKNNPEIDQITENIPEIEQTSENNPVPALDEEQLLNSDDDESQVKEDDKKSTEVNTTNVIVQNETEKKDKETVKVDENNSDFELAFDNDEDNTELSDDVLKLIDEELGIDEKSDEKVEKIDERVEIKNTKEQENEEVDVTPEVSSEIKNDNKTDQNDPIHEDEQEIIVPDIVDQVTDSIENIVKNTEIELDSNELETCDSQNDENMETVPITHDSNVINKDKDQNDTEKMEHEVSDVLDQENNISEGTDDDKIEILEQKTEIVNDNDKVAEKAELNAVSEKGLESGEQAEVTNKLIGNIEKTLEDKSKVEEVCHDKELCTAEKETESKENIDKDIVENTNNKAEIPEVSKETEWDDDVDDQAAVQPLSDDALKRLDEELGIAEETEITPDVELKFTKLITDSKEDIPKAIEEVEPSKQSDSENIVEKDVEKAILTDIPEETVPKDIKMEEEQTNNETVIEQNIEKIEATDISNDTPKDDPDIIKSDMDTNIIVAEKEIEETSIDIKTLEEDKKEAENSEIDVDIQNDEKPDEIKEANVSKEDAPKIRVLNVAEINFEHKSKDFENVQTKDNDSILNISVEKNEIVIDATKSFLNSEKEVITPDMTNENIGKTDHKITRPDVMIDIPTQELIDCDEEMKRDEPDFSMTSKTVTEIVNQLENSTKIDGKENDKDKSIENKKDTDKIDTNVESEPSTSKMDDPKPSSEDLKVTEDLKTSEVSNSAEDDEQTDTLDLLAESTMVPDDDEEPEAEQEDDDADNDGDDDDEIDHDDESSNQMTTAEHSEDSTDHPQTDTEQDSTNKRNFIKVSEPQVVVEKVTEACKEGESNDGDDAEAVLRKEDKVTEKLEEILKSTISSGESTNKRRRSILLELLSKIDDEDESESSSKEKTDEKSQKEVTVVDLGGSDSEEDTKETKKDKKSDTPTADQKTDKSDVAKDSKAKKDDGDDKAKEKETKEIDEIFDLDSDEEIIAEIPVNNNRCINNNCTSDDTVQYYIADAACMSHYCVAKRRLPLICTVCLDFVVNRSKDLVSGIKDLRPLMELEMSATPQQLVEISDSDSDDGDDDKDAVIGDYTARLLEDKLEDLFNTSWLKYKMDDRLRDTEEYLTKELLRMEQQSKEVDELLNKCEKETDKLRIDLYQQFEPPKHELPALYIHDTPIASYFCQEKDEKIGIAEITPRYPKRQGSFTAEVPNKKQALDKYSLIPDVADQTKDDDKDISVVQLSAENPPAELPPPGGEMTRAALKVGMSVYAMKNSFGAWLQGKVLDVMGKNNGFTNCRIKFEHNVRNTCKVLSARCIAYSEPSNVRLTIGTRVVALFKNPSNADQKTEPRKESYYSGVVAEVPNPVNHYRYLVFFDDGYAQYVYHQHTRLVAESSDKVWEEVHPFSRDFVYNYLQKYPERPMVRMHKGQTISVELNGKWYETKVLCVDASLVQVLFLEENRAEWIYRGSTRLRPLFVEFQAAKGAPRARLPRSTRNSSKLSNVPYVEYTRSDEQNKNVPQTPQPVTEEQRRQRAVAKKSTGLPQQQAPLAPSEGVTSRVVYYTPKHAVRPHKFTPHSCGPRCRRTDVLSLTELRTYNPLAKPLLSGWERNIIRYKGHRTIMYRAPCGRRLRNMAELHRYLSALRSDLSVDLFDFNYNTHCLAEFVLTKYNVGKKDLSHGKENVPVACVNYYDTSLPEFCSYNTERTPTAGVPLNLDPEFLCGCDCVDDCVDKSKCACWQMTLEGARTIGLEGDNIGYQYRRLLEPLPTGIYECNSRCKCKNTCLNRVAQHPLQLKLQVFKTINRGWGIRALNDVPKGSFLCIYAGNLLTDATANLDGLNEGDEYLAELDYIEVVEGMKEGYEQDVVEPDDNGDKKDETENEEDTESDKSDDERNRNDDDKEDCDFQPGFIGMGLTEFSKRLRIRDKKKSKDDSKDKEDYPKDDQNKDGDDCITISDDDEVREPARFTAQEGMKDNKLVSKYVSIRDYFGEDEACYIMDAKVQGNIGRYLNHSCSPNVFVQNVFVDTHDPRFPWVSFFALHHIKAGTELTWNYNYDVGSVPGKVLYCFCSAVNCRGRLL